MSAAPWQKILDLFEQVVELPPEEREDFLDKACEDPKTRRAVEEMLAVDAGDGDESTEGEDGIPTEVAPAPKAGATSDEPYDQELPKIGNYRLLRKVGQGGMSTAYLAVRDDDTFRRQVVIKLVREDRESEPILRRLRIERQILAALEHPYIARLYDGGSTEDGLPYFVMEYVDGLPIDDYCRQQDLSVEERLGLFRKVCQAVQFAHQNLVVHRDIKPSNILVTADGIPKLLDFGIAKLLDPDLISGENEPTAAWQRLLTPSYASPEQLTGRPITTASDVYSLGVLLYELLTGRLPRRHQAESLDRLENDLLGSEPPAPSEALAETGAGSEGHPESTGRLRQRIRGDLDAIVLRTLRTDPARRYASVGRLIEDLERFEGGFPVLAREGGLRYRAGKLVRRHRVAVAVLALIAVLLVGFVTAIAWQSVRVAEERDEKQAVLELILDMFRLSNPHMRPGEKLTVHEALQLSLPVLDSRLHDQPSVRAALLHESGVILSVIGENRTAVEHLEEALDLRRELRGERHADTIETLLDLASALRNLGELDEAEALVLGAAEITRDANRQSELARALVDLASIYCHRGDFQAVEGPAQEALELLATLPSSPSQAILAREYMAQVRSSEGNYEESEALYRQALDERRRHFGDEHPTLIPALGNLGIVLRRQGDFEAALETYNQVLDLEHANFGEDWNDPITLSSIAGAHFGQGDYANAQNVYGQAIEAVLEVIGPENWRILLYRTRIEQARLRLGHPAEAEANLRSLIAEWRPRLRQGHARIAQAQSVLGEAVSVQGRCDEAEPILVGALDALAEAKHRLRSDATELLKEHLERCGRSAEVPEDATQFPAPAG